MMQRLVVVLATAVVAVAATLAVLVVPRPTWAAPMDDSGAAQTFAALAAVCSAGSYTVQRQQAQEQIVLMVACRERRP